MNKPIHCKYTGEVVNSYPDYLNTNHWKNKRKRIARLRNHICEKCGKMVYGNFEVHHITYKDIGNEKDWQLKLYCQECHKIVHLKPKKQLKSITKKPTIKSKTTKKGLIDFLKFFKK